MLNLLGFILGLIVPTATVLFTLRWLVQKRNLNNFLVILFSILAGTGFWIISLILLMIPEIIMKTTHSFIILAFGVSMVFELITFVVLGIVIIKKRCPNCRFMAAYVSGEGDVLQTVHDHINVKNYEGYRERKDITRVLLEVPYSCKNCGHEWTKFKRETHKGHLH